MMQSGRPDRRRLTSDAPDSLKTRIALGCIVVASVGMGLIWLIFTPFFQAPDENAHFDYAYQLYSVGRPYHVERAKCARDVTETVRYIERRSDFYGVRLLADARVPRGYGTPEYFRSVDALAPRLARRIPPAGSNAPCVMFGYPAGFYAVAAGVVALASAASQGSLVAELFSARAFGIVCLAVTLPLAYRVLRASGIRVRDALLATAAIGIFPMTSWVSAYIQPDNLVFTLVTLALLVALRLRSRPFDPLASIALGAVLSTLFFVKQQYAGVLFIACALLVLSSSLRERHPYRRALTVCFVCLLPLVALRLSTFATPVGPLRISHNLAPTAIAPTSAKPLVSAGLDVLYAASSLRDAYVDGLSFHRFWNSFGWADNSYLSRPWLNETVESAIGVVSLSIAFFFVTRQLNVYRRVLRIARRRSAATASWLLCQDVVLNVYIVWTTLLIIVCAASRGTWSLQGRYWLPVMVPMMVILIARVPRILPSGTRARTATLAAGMMLGYALVLGPIALAAAHERYYRPSGELPRLTVVGVDGVGFLGRLPRGSEPTTMRSGRVVDFKGLAFRSTDGSPIDHIDLQIDAGRPMAMRYGFTVATAVAPMSVGFEGTIPTKTLAVGRHRISVLAYSDARHFDRWDTGVVIDVARDVHPKIVWKV